MKSAKNKANSSSSSGWKQGDERYGRVKVSDHIRIPITAKKNSFIVMDQSGTTSTSSTSNSVTMTKVPYCSVNGDFQD